MEHKNLVVCKANKVIEAGYKLTLMEQRLIQACIAQVNSTEELVSTKKFELSAKDFAKLYEISEPSAYDELKQVSKQLFHRYVTIENPDPEQPKIKQTITHWITSIDYIPDEGKIVLFFAPKILPYLGQLKGSFTYYRLEHVSKMTCVYAIRLYELLMQWKNTGTREIEIAWLKKQFQIENEYERMDNFKKRVIEPAVKDINTHSNFKVAWEQRKTGRAVTHLIFTFVVKQSVEPKALEESTISQNEKSAVAAVDNSLSEEQQKCWNWAKTEKYWSSRVYSKKAFLTHYNAESGALRGQYENALLIQKEEEQKTAPKKTAPAKPLWQLQGFNSEQEYNATHLRKLKQMEANVKGKAVNG